MALCEGGDVLCQTRTGSEGCFDIEVNLYGKPFILSGGGSEWRPEGYYAVLAQADNGKKARLLLRESSPTEQIVLYLH